MIADFQPLVANGISVYKLAYMYTIALSLVSCQLFVVRYDYLLATGNPLHTTGGVEVNSPPPLVVGIKCSQKSRLELTPGTN